MSDFIQYHKADEWGFPGRTTDGHLGIGTEKADRGRAINHRVWLVSGHGRPTRYALHYWFIATQVTERGLIGWEGSRARREEGEPLNGYDWFRRLYIDRKLYSLGFNSLSSENGRLLADEFEKLAAKWPKPKSVQKPSLSPTPEKRQNVAVLSPGPPPMQRPVLFRRNGEKPALTMNIKRKWFAAIVAGTKLVEYRRHSPTWQRQIGPLKAPFVLRLLNGMLDPVPEAEVMVRKVITNYRTNEYELHLGPVLKVKRWDRKNGRPLAR